jgi:ABC-type nickel/cobalt efflux system permease component RcnA
MLPVPSFLMKRGDFSPTLRGFLIVLAIAAVIFALQLERTLTALFLLARIAFFLAIAFFLYLVWRERRGEIETWSRRAKVVFYGSALLLAVNVGARFFAPAHSGWDLFSFVVVLVLGGFAMWRVWRDQHTYGY